jgi:hypothetical protein
MPIPINPYLATQFSGPCIQSCAGGIQASFDAMSPLISYWTLLSLSTATGPELDFMGALAGFPRPNVPSQFVSLNMFTLGTAGGWETLDSTHGLGDSSNPSVGGQLGSSQGMINNPMPDSWYRVMIPLMAILKYYGITLFSVDQLVGTVAISQGTTYVLSYVANGDINCTLAVDISYPPLWILQQAFNYYETDCTVTVINP